MKYLYFIFLTIAFVLLIFGVASIVFGTLFTYVNDYQDKIIFVNSFLN